MSAKENDKLFGGSGRAVRGIENPRMESRHWWLVVVMEEERPWRCDDRGVDLGDSNLASGWRSGGGRGEGGSHGCLKWWLTDERRAALSLAAETWLADSAGGKIWLVKWRGSTWRNSRGECKDFSKIISRLWDMQSLTAGHAKKTPTDITLSVLSLKYHN